MMEVLYGVIRGEMLFGLLFWMVGLRFVVLRGNFYESEVEGDWIVVLFYGMIGVLIKGFEYEIFGVGINYI